MLGGVQSSGYLIFGQAFENGDRKDNAKGTGLFTGYAFHANFGVAGWTGRVARYCYPWARASVGYDMDMDAGLEINPVRFDVAMGFGVHMEFRAGCARRDRGFANKQEVLDWNGRGFGFGVNATVNGHLQAFSPIAFDGSASIEIDLPWPLPNPSVTVSVSF